MSVRITDTQLLTIFQASPLSRRMIRRKLGRPANSVVSAVLYSACERGVVHKVRPSDIGSCRHSLHVYAPTHSKV